MSAWQPIETAPRDGTEVWLLFSEEARSERRLIGAWLPWGDRSHPFIWQDHNGRALHRPWKFDDAFDDPTHWAPLVKPPIPEAP